MNNDCPQLLGRGTAVSQSSASLYTSLNYSRHDRLIVQFTLNHMPIPGLHVSLALSDSRKKLVRHDHLSEVAIPGAINGRVFPCVQEKAKKQKPWLPNRPEPAQRTDVSQPLTMPG
ncbi:hypothetical protein J6590_058776 [Homalodisca vitripennis]|nr:hypothetical protein J6590_058776 [Homalodisca vitripennis]